jgi:uridine phosphorylase
VRPEYPAVATADSVLALTAAAPAHKARAHRGVVWTRAAFSPMVRELPMAECLAARVIAVGMARATLLVFAALKGLRAGGVLVVDGNATVDNTDPASYNPHRRVVVDAVARGGAVALDTLVAPA